ncbi:MAG: two-component system response regulator [Microbacterium sp.]|nr:MAG: two-component system response regulator [Microbacterium sp.]PZU38362.1 MAG: two-component system response regulator [Microbacterium sp.]
MSDPSAPLKTAVIIEDDPEIRHLIVEVLEAAGFSTVSVGNGIDGVRAVASYQPSITTLDVNMPGIDGFEAARRIRAQSDTYIIMITGLEEEADLVVGLGAGADDYIVKPFRPRELRARVDSLMRRPRTTTQNQPPAPRQEVAGPSFPGARPGIRTPDYSAPAAYDQRSTPATPSGPPYGFDDVRSQPAPPPAYAQPAPPSAPAAQPIIVPSTAGPQYSEPGSDLATVGHTAGEIAGPGWVTHRDLSVNPEQRTAVIGGAELELTRTEFDLLATLMESKRRVRSKADLTLVLRGESYVTSYFVGEADKRAIEAHMTNLRRKLGDNPTNPRYIETVRGVGYRLTSERAA